MKKVLIVGAGFSGLTIAHKLAQCGIKVTVIDKREHIGGNCYDERDKKTGINIHVYGPHIFHTDNKEVWDYVSNFTDFMPYITRLKAKAKGQIYSLPVNLHTINQYYSASMSPTEAKELIKDKGDSSILEPKSFEEQAIKFVGYDLYKTFFYGYPKKQWGMEPSDIPASVLQRLPVRFNYDDNYFFHKYQGIPANGYVEIFKAMINSSENIEVKLNTQIKRTDIEKYLNDGYSHVFFSGETDDFYDYEFGRLEYRTLKFEKFYTEDDFQGCAVMSYCDEDVPFTRITEHKYFTPWEKHKESVCYKEYSSSCKEGDTPYYPVRHVGGNEIWEKYEEKLNTENNITFVGRLATYRYMDMDVCIKEALQVASNFIEKLINND
ncbi:UDP-galactopyranose mutase [Vibrio fluvialis]|nr:UDP-galactopyranose mutase [Vibrio fluvialis]MBY8202535.1 UDP-galactopyranose mutase [Vibrio fluvialis]MBY8206438.1 UDP-galactopyranose mutase [Vibrio fluvialis]